MSNFHHMQHRKQKTGLSYPISLPARLYSIFFSPFLLLVLVILAGTLLFHIPIESAHVDFSYLFLALLYTFGRLVIAFVLALIVSVTLAFLATASEWTERILLPLFDILESIPTLAFFPIIIIFFVNSNLLNLAAIFILFLSMVWNIVFTAVGGLKIIPRDIKFAAQIFKITKISYFTKVLLPAIFPELVTGSILAFAQGWNIIIIAEVLHVYIPNGTSADDLFGIGSILVQTISNGQNGLFFAALSVMILAIALMNFFIWQKLLHVSRRFKFE